MACNCSDCALAFVLVQTTSRARPTRAAASAQAGGPARGSGGSPDPSKAGNRRTRMLQNMSESERCNLPLASSIHFNSEIDSISETWWEPPEAHWSKGQPAIVLSMSTLNQPALIRTWCCCFIMEQASPISLQSCKKL